MDEARTITVDLPTDVADALDASIGSGEFANANDRDLTAFETVE